MWHLRICHRSILIHSIRSLNHRSCWVDILAHTSLLYSLRMFLSLQDTMVHTSKYCYLHTIPTDTLSHIPMLYHQHRLVAIEGIVKRICLLSYPSTNLMDTHLHKCGRYHQRMCHQGRRICISYRQDQRRMMGTRGTCLHISLLNYLQSMHPNMMAHIF